TTAPGPSPQIHFPKTGPYDIRLGYTRLPEFSRRLTAQGYAIVEQARRRWDIFDALVIHRVGRLLPSDQIVLVAVTGAHRGEAFAACEFIMDYLKTRAPFWKKEQTPEGSRWVEARASDDAAAARWERS
ncbi:MAG: molybdenum cofactor biosynthesis protein MoaE, partial [Burkholderiales bacterium]